jgi:hypothetical protein
MILSPSGFHLYCLYWFFRMFHPERGKSSTLISPGLTRDFKKSEIPADSACLSLLLFGRAKITGKIRDTVHALVQFFATTILRGPNKIRQAKLPQRFFHKQLTVIDWDAAFPNGLLGPYFSKMDP